MATPCHIGSSATAPDAGEAVADATVRGGTGAEGVVAGGSAALPMADWWAPPPRAAVQVRMCRRPASKNDGAFVLLCSSELQRKCK